MASTRRRSPSGRSASPLPIVARGQPFPDRLSFPSSRKPSSSPFASTRCCRSTTASMLFRPRSLSSPALPFIVALERHGISRLPEVEGDKPRRKKSEHLSDRLLPHRYRRGEDRRRQALPVRGDRPHPRSSPSWSLWDEPTCKPPPPSLHHSSRPFPIASIRCSPTTASSSPTCRRTGRGQPARFRGHPFDRLCQAHGIEHRLTKPNHPCLWSNRDQRAGRAHGPDHQGPPPSNDTSTIPTTNSKRT